MTAIYVINLIARHFTKKYGIEYLSFIFAWNQVSSIYEWPEEVTTATLLLWQDAEALL